MRSLLLGQALGYYWGSWEPSAVLELLGQDASTPALSTLSPERDAKVESLVEAGERRRQLLDPFSETRIEAAFDAIDLDDSGAIDMDELLHVLGSARGAAVCGIPLPEPTAGGETEWLEMAVAGLLSKELAGREPEGRALGEARRQLVGGEKPPSPPSPPPVCGDLFVGEAHSAITGAAAAVQDGSVLEVCETVCEANKRCYCGVLKGAVLDALPEGPLRLTANTAITTACLTSFNWKKLVCTPACKAISSAVADSSAPANLQMATDASCVSVATGVTDAWCQETCSNQAQCPTTVCRCEPDEPAGRRLQFAQEAEVSDTINGFLLDGSRSDLLELSLAKLLTPHLLGSGFFTEPIVATTRGGAIDHGSRRLANGDCADTLAADAVMAVRHTTAFVTAPYKDRTDMCKTLCTENKDCYCHILKGPLVDNALEQSSMSTAGVAPIKSAIFGACATSLTWRTSACVPACNVVAATTTVVEGALSYLESVLQIFGLSVAELVRKQLLKPLAQAA